MLGTFLVGMVVGLVARAMHPRGPGLTVPMALLLGGVGALASFYLGRALRWFIDGQLSGWTAAILGAALLVGLAGLFARRGR